MAQAFTAKVIQVGSSRGILIPKPVLMAEGISEGDEVEFSVIKRNFKLLESLFGTMKGAKPFVRDRTDRSERIERARRQLGLD